MANKNFNNKKQNYRKELTDFQVAILKRKAELEAEEANTKYNALYDSNASFGDLLDAFEAKQKANKRLQYRK